jgi:hypothetical protein
MPEGPVVADSGPLIAFSLLGRGRGDHPGCPSLRIAGDQMLPLVGQRVTQPLTGRVAVRVL